MSWRQVATHAWREPLDFAGDVAHHPEIALLYSGRQERFSGDFSYLFLEPATQITGSRWAELPLPNDTEPLPQWIGYLGYGMRAGIEHYRRNAPSFIDLPDFWLVAYQRMFRFDHQAQRIEEFISIPLPPYRFTKKQPLESRAPVKRLASNFTHASYEACIDATLEKIRAGEFYQANITRKFFGEFEATPDSWQVFRALCTASPSPYSAFIKHGGVAILSSSPECFLSLDAQGGIASRPIKGSARRGATPEEDEQLRSALLASEKNSVENLMIVDLMRNDLARVSVAGSVAVAEQSVLYSYATIHHLVSTVTAKKRPGASAYDVVAACFPPGSMTGAPKIAAINWCDTQEKLERGVYSGAIGWFGGGDTCDLSVVIRTLILDDNRFEFQVGGGIVADSDPAEEWQETLIKARGIAIALGINEEDLAKL